MARVQSTARWHQFSRTSSSTIASRPVLFVECSDAGREASWSQLTELGYRCESAVTGKAVESYEAYRHSDFLWVPGAG
jgi:hypothetical protein